MYAELVLVAWVRRLRDEGKLPEGKRLVYVWDNFSAHHVKVVKDAFQAAGVDILCLLPNTTDILQVMDLVVNGPGKAFLRSARVRYEALQAVACGSETVAAVSHSSPSCGATCTLCTVRFWSTSRRGAWRV
jgi:hypothetical protein